MSTRLRFLALLLSAIASASALADEGRQYMVEMELWIDGEQRGAPIVVTSPGEAASLEISDPSGDGAWRIEVLLEPPMASEGAPMGSLWLNLTVHEKVDGEWEALADSLIGVPEGRTGTMAVVESIGETATPENSLVYLTAQTSLLRPGAAGN